MIVSTPPSDALRDSRLGPRFPSWRRVPKRGTILLLAVFLLPACDDPDRLLAPDTDAALASTGAGHGDITPGRFIVTLRPGAQPAAVAAAHGVEPAYVYTHVLNGFAGSISDAARSGLLRDARVSAVEPDRWINPAEAVQADPVWGLDRIDQRALPLDDQYHRQRTGAGVTVYVIDSGIRLSHDEFEGRATNGYDFVWHDPEVSDAVKGSAEGEDCRGHGTHIAGTIGGRTYGVAKDVDLVSVRIFGCTGGAPGRRTVAALDWVTADLERSAGPAVANLSLTGSGAPATRDALLAMISAGVATVAAAGNAGLENGCHFPGDMREVMTVGATNVHDWRASFSNYGDCVDWFAPGEAIISAGHTGDTDTWLASGTSMSTPHGAGVAALYLEAHPLARPAEVLDALRRAATRNAVRDWEYQYHRNGRVIGQTEVLRGDLLYSLIDAAGVKPELTDAAIEAISSSEIRLTWIYHGEEQAYVEIQRWNRDLMEYRTIATEPAGAGAFLDEGLDPYTLYYYRIRAAPTAGVTDWSVVLQAITHAGEDMPAVSITIYEVECSHRGENRCTFKTQGGGPVTSILWTVEPNGSYGPWGRNDWWLTLVFSNPGTYTATITVADALGNTAQDSASVRCWIQGSKLRCE
jgi:hypothetical protein